MTASKQDGQSCMRLERLPKALVDYSKVHHVGGGPYKGILINKEASALDEDDTAEARLEFMAFLSDQENDNEPIQDYWILKFWFQSGTDGISRKKAFTDYFQELMSPKDFPKNYIGFVKRALVLLKKYTKIRRVDLVVQKSDETPPEDEVLSIQSFVTVYTPDSYTYQLVPEVPVTNKTFLTFKIKAGGDAHIALSAIYGDLERKTHEIVIGTEHNTKSMIRDGSMGPVKAEVLTYSLLHPNEFRFFWINWADNHIEVGRGAKYGHSRFLSWQVPENRRFNINSVAVSTGRASRGQWEFADLLDDLACAELEVSDSSAFQDQSPPMDEDTAKIFRLGSSIVISSKKPWAGSQMLSQPWGGSQNIETQPLVRSQSMKVVKTLDKTWKSSKTLDQIWKQNDSLPREPAWKSSQGLDKVWKGSEMRDPDRRETRKWAGTQSLTRPPKNGKIDRWEKGSQTLVQANTFNHFIERPPKDSQVTDKQEKGSQTLERSKSFSHVIEPQKDNQIVDGSSATDHKQKGSQTLRRSKSFKHFVEREDKQDAANGRTADRRHRGSQTLERSKSFKHFSEQKDSQNVERSQVPYQRHRSNKTPIERSKSFKHFAEREKNQMAKGNEVPIQKRKDSISLLERSKTFSYFIERDRKESQIAGDRWKGSRAKLQPPKYRSMDKRWVESQILAHERQLSNEVAHRLCKCIRRPDGSWKINQTLFPFWKCKHAIDAEKKVCRVLAQECALGTLVTDDEDLPLDQRETKKQDISEDKELPVHAHETNHKEIRKDNALFHHQEVGKRNMPTNDKDLAARSREALEKETTRDNECNDRTRTSGKESWYGNNQGDRSSCKRETAGISGEQAGNRQDVPDRARGGTSVEAHRDDTDQTDRTLEIPYRVFGDDNGHDDRAWETSRKGYSSDSELTDRNGESFGKGYEKDQFRTRRKSEKGFGNNKKIEDRTGKPYRNAIDTEDRSHGNDSDRNERTRRRSGKGYGNDTDHTQGIYRSHSRETSREGCRTQSDLDYRTRRTSGKPHRNNNDLGDRSKRTNENGYGNDNDPEDRTQRTSGKEFRTANDFSDRTQHTSGKAYIKDNVLVDRTQIASGKGFGNANDMIEHTQGASGNAYKLANDSEDSSQAAFRNTYTNDIHRTKRTLVKEYDNDTNRHYRTERNWFRNDTELADRTGRKPGKAYRSNNYLTDHIYRTPGSAYRNDSRLVDRSRKTTNQRSRTNRDLEYLTWCLSGKRHSDDIDHSDRTRQSRNENDLSDRNRKTSDKRSKNKNDLEYLTRVLSGNGHRNDNDRSRNDKTQKDRTRGASDDRSKRDNNLTDRARGASGDRSKRDNDLTDRAREASGDRSKRDNDLTDRARGASGDRSKHDNDLTDRAREASGDRSKHDNDLTDRARGASGDRSKRDNDLTDRTREASIDRSKRDNDLSDRTRGASGDRSKSDNDLTDRARGASGDRLKPDKDLTDHARGTSGNRSKHDNDLLDRTRGASGDRSKRDNHLNDRTRGASGDRSKRDNDLNDRTRGASGDTSKRDNDLNDRTRGASGDRSKRDNYLTDRTHGSRNHRDITRGTSGKASKGVNFLADNSRGSSGRNSRYDTYRSGRPRERQSRNDIGLRDRGKLRQPIDRNWGTLEREYRSGIGLSNLSWDKDLKSRSEDGLNDHPVRTGFTESRKDKSLADRSWRANVSEGRIYHNVTDRTWGTVVTEPRVDNCLSVLAWGTGATEFRTMDNLRSNNVWGQFGKEPSRSYRLAADRKWSSAHDLDRFASLQIYTQTEEICPQKPYQYHTELEAYVPPKVPPKPKRKNLVSKNHDQISLLAQPMDEESLRGFEIPPSLDGTEKGNCDFSKAARKRRAKLSLLWLAKRQRMLYALEDAYPNSVAVNKLLETCKIKAADMISAAVMLKDLQKRGLIQELDQGFWMRMPRGPKDTNENIQMVEEMPRLSYKQQPKIAIVTALYVEKLAVDAMIEDKSTFVRYKTEGESQVYTIGKIGKYNVVSTKLSRLGSAQDAMISAENTMTRLLGTFNKVEHVFLVGVAGGVPHFSDFKQHVRLGDVVVSTPLDKSQSLYVECTKVEKMQGVTGYSYLTRAYQCADATLNLAVQQMRAIYESGGVDRTFDAYIEEAKDHLNAEESSFHRPSMKTDKLFMTTPGGDQIQLEHPKPVGALARTYREGQPQVRYGVIGAGRMVARSEYMRREFAEMNEIKAFDAGYDAVLESLEGNRNDSFLVIRGIADYLDGTTKDWQSYASLTAAAYMKAIIYALD